MPEENDQDCGGSQNNPQHLLILAYVRLFLLSEQTDGVKVSTIANRGCLELRLVEYTVRDPVPSLWIELLDTGAGRVIESVSCRSLQDAGAVTERLFHERLSGSSE